MLDAAEVRQHAEHRQLAAIIAFAVNDPKNLDKAIAKPSERPSPSQVEGGDDFVGERWW